MDYLKRLRENADLSPAEGQELLTMAAEEHARLLKHDEEIVVPENLPEEIHRRLDEGRELALSRARDVSEVVGGIVGRVEITRLPKSLQSFHPDYFKTVAAEQTREDLRRFGLGDGPER